MSDPSDHRPAHAFFLDATPGKRFCMYYPANPLTECKGAIIYAHPFGDEMNKSRRMAAMQARAFAANGYAVLQPDLFGCGDSSGEFHEARWEIWKSDLARAQQWLQDCVAVPVSLWGLRLGALLALDYARSSPQAIHSIILWQPVIHGELFLTHFLRLQLAGKMLAGIKETAHGTQALRAALAAGETLDIAGYEIAPALAAAIDQLDVSEVMATKSTIHWIEIVADASRGVTPATVRVTNAWKQNGIDLYVRQVPGASFWSTQEIVECPEVVALTTRVCSGAQA
jgi:exosortase A-associated hydrolase 2